MMKNKLWLLFLVVSILGSSCSSENEVLSDILPSEQIEHVINLQQLSFTEMRDLLDNKTELKNVLFKDGELSKKVSLLKLDERMDVMEHGSNEKTLFYRGQSTDSLFLTLSKELFSLKLVSNSNELAYVAYADPRQTDMAMAMTQKGMPQTRNGMSVATRASADINSFRLNITDGLKLMKNDGVSKCEKRDCDCSHILNEEPPATTRAPYYTRWPRGNQLTIHLIRDQNDLPWEHEITWQVNDLVTSLVNLRSDLRVKVWRSTVGFRGSSSKKALDELVRFCNSSRFPWKESANRDIIVAVRQFNYGTGLGGLAYVNAYNIRRYNNPYAYGISTTSAWAPSVLAHEVGHILGADHVPERPWYMKLFWKDDIMIAVNNWFVGNIHFDNNNRKRIRSNIY